MQWSAWTNGSPRGTGSGLGLQVSTVDRRRHFDPRWRHVLLELETNDAITEVRANVGKPSFWSPSCGELISAQIGQWLIAQGLVPWAQNIRPKFQVSAVGNRRFRVRRLRRLASREGEIGDIA